MGICKAPFSSITLDQDLKIRPCCVSDAELGRFQSPADISEAFVGRDLESLRQEFLDGKFPASCESCSRSKKLGRISKKEKYDRRLEKYGELAFAKTIDLNNLLILEVNFSNLCNLDCVFCSSLYSTKWIERDQALLSQGLRDQSDISNKIESLPMGEIDQWVEILDQAENLSEIEINGGEPSLNEGFYVFLEAYKRSKSKASIWVTTNGTQISNRLLPYLQDIPQLHFDISIDGVGTYYEYVRGFSFHEIEKNIKDYLKHSGRDQLLMHYTVCNLNILGMADFCDWVENLQKEYSDFSFQVRFDQQVANPSYLSPWVLPEHLLLEAKKQINSILTHKFPFIRAGELQALLAYISNEDKKLVLKELRNLKEFIPFHNKSRSENCVSLGDWVDAI